MENIIERIQNRWKKEVGNRISMCSAPSLYALKKDILDYQKEVFLRSLLPFQNYASLAEPIPAKWVHACAVDMHEALYYGAMATLLDYAGISGLTMPPMNLGVQHGYVFEICNWEKSKLNMRNLVWSKRLVDMHKDYNSNPNIFAIGAPFFYAKSLLSEENLSVERKRLGRNLLAFPMHSQGNVDTNYNPENFLNILIEERKRFDTVRVCMYWKDILRGSHKVFVEAGFECVCNGHIYDTNFIRRQKSLFELADATISNGVGSHIGYSLYMEKPHWLIDDQYEYINSKRSGDAEDLTAVTKMNNFLKVKEAFLGNADYKITSKQKSVVDEWWGVSDMKSPMDLRLLLLKLYGIDV